MAPPFNVVGWDVDLEIGDSSALQLNEVGREFGNQRWLRPSIEFGGTRIQKSSIASPFNLDWARREFLNR